MVDVGAKEYSIGGGVAVVVVVVVAVAVAVAVEVASVLAVLLFTPPCTTLSPSAVKVQSAVYFLTAKDMLSKATIK